MPSRPQNRAGREVAEDVKRAIRRAIRFVGLKEHKIAMVLAEGQQARLIMGGGKPDGWRYDLPPLSVAVTVKANGDISLVKVHCYASDEDPITSVVGGALIVTDCLCELADLPRVLKELWADRQELVARQTAGESLRSFVGSWHWGWSEI